MAEQRLFAAVIERGIRDYKQLVMGLRSDRPLDYCYHWTNTYARNQGIDAHNSHRRRVLLEKAKEFIWWLSASEDEPLSLRWLCDSVTGDERTGKGLYERISNYLQLIG